jgi:hypothetical protein
LREGKKHDTDRKKDADSGKNCICRWECLNKKLERLFFRTKYVDIHKSNTLASGGRKGIQYIDSRGNPFCEWIISILGLIESRDLFSQNSKNSVGGVAGLKAGKKGMGG